MAGVSIDDLSQDALNRFRKEAAKSNRVDEDVLNDSTENLLEDLRLKDYADATPIQISVYLDHIVF